MDIWDVVKKAGAGVLSAVVPGAGVVIDVVNEFLDEDNKLPKDATGKQVENAIKTMPPEIQAQLANREFDLKEKSIEANVALMTGGPAQETRAWIARWAFVLVAVVTLAAVIVWGKAAIWDKNDTMVKTITDGWEWLAVLLLPFVGWLNRYFGILRQEQQDRLAAGNGSTPISGVAGLVKLFKNK